MGYQVYCTMLDDNNEVVYRAFWSNPGDIKEFWHSLPETGMISTEDGLAKRFTGDEFLECVRAYYRRNPARVVFKRRFVERVIDNAAFFVKNEFVPLVVLEMGY